MIRDRTSVFFLAIALRAALFTLSAGCEDERDRQAREEGARSVRDLARLLRTKECVDCYIVDAELRGRDLRGIRLQRSFLHGNLRGADLSGARIADSGLGGDLAGADLRGASVDQLSLSVGNKGLAGARLEGLDLRTTRFADTTDWRGVQLAGANLSGLTFGAWGGPRRRMEVPKGCLTGADLRAADLSGAWLSSTDLRDTDLRGANLRGAHLPPTEHLAGANFEGATAPNGETCGGMSIGRCLTGKREQPPWR